MLAVFSVLLGKSNQEKVNVFFYRVKEASSTYTLGRLVMLIGVFNVSLLEAIYLHISVDSGSLQWYAVNYSRSA